jgi:hypothetical protein
MRTGNLALPYKYEGPASAPTLPSHGSENPSRKDISMNSMVHSMPAPAGATKDDGTADDLSAAQVRRARSRTIFDLDRLGALKPRDLHHLTDALYVVCSVFSGFHNQPRFLNDDESGCNGAGELLAELDEMIMEALDDIRHVAREAEARTEEDAEYKAWVEIHGHALYGDDLLTVAHLALNGLNVVRTIEMDKAAGRLPKKAVSR